MKILGIVGGVASGKTFYTQLFQKQGASVFNADQAAHDVLNERTIKQKIRLRWGEAPFLPDGSVDRKKIAEIVFQPNEDSAMERLYLESIVYPAIRQKFEKFLDQSETEGAFYVILDAAMLLEAGWDKLCDAIAFVDTPEDIRRNRAIESRGWTAEQLLGRENAQLSLKKKRRKALYVLKGDLSAEDSEKAVLELMKKLTGDKE